MPGKPLKFEDSFGLWNMEPTIEGFSEDESKKIYSGDFDAVFERFRRMADKERDDAILDLLPEIGHASLYIINQLEIDIEENNKERTRECSKNLKNLSTFSNQFIELYQGEEK